MPSMMHLGVMFENGPTQHTIGGWALPRNLVGYDWTLPEFWQDTARLLERSKFDMAFFADNLSAYDTFGGSPDTSIRYSVQFPVHDPIPLVSYMAAATTHIGIAATSTTGFVHPYTTARAFGTLAHLTQSRVGWNAVSSSNNAAADNFGLDFVLEHDQRYERAGEFIEVCQKLWSSWDADAIVADRDHRFWADPQKVRRIEHRGRFYRCRGPLNVAPAPLGPPVIITAGQSERGLQFAATYAEAVFAIQFSVPAMRRHRDAFQEKLVEAGRDEGSVPIFWGVTPIVAQTEAEAREKEAMIKEVVPPEGGIALVCAHFGIDISSLDWDSPLERVQTDGSQGMVDALAKNYGRTITLREAGQFYGSGIAPVVGSPSQVAEQLIAMHDDVGGDGFLLVPHYLPGSLHEFTEWVVPLLQHAGRFRTAYSGQTLRDHLREN